MLLREYSLLEGRRVITHGKKESQNYSVWATNSSFFYNVDLLSNYFIPFKINVYSLAFHLLAQKATDEFIMITEHRTDSTS